MSGHNRNYRNVHNRVQTFLGVVASTLCVGARATICGNSGFGATFQPLDPQSRFRSFQTSDSSFAGPYGVGCAFTEISANSVAECEAACIGMCQAYEYTAIARECNLFAANCNCTSATGSVGPGCDQVATIQHSGIVSVVSARRQCMTAAPTAAPTEEVFCAGTSFEGPLTVTSGANLARPPITPAMTIASFAATVAVCNASCLNSHQCAGYDISWPSGTVDFSLRGTCILVRDARHSPSEREVNYNGFFYTRAPSCIYGGTNSPTSVAPTGSPTASPTYSQRILSCSYSLFASAVSTTLLDTASDVLLPNRGQHLYNITSDECAELCSASTQVSPAVPRCAGYQLIFNVAQAEIRGICFLVSSVRATTLPVEQVLGADPNIAGLAYRREACVTALRTTPPSPHPTAAPTLVCPGGSALAGQVDAPYCPAIISQESAVTLCPLFVDVCPNMCNSPNCRSAAPTSGTPSSAPTSAAPSVPSPTVDSTTITTTTTTSTSTTTTTTSITTTTTTSHDDEWLCEGHRDQEFCFAYRNVLKPNAQNCSVFLNIPASHAILALCPALCNGTILEPGILDEDPDKIDGVYTPCRFDSSTSTITSTTTTTIPDNVCESLGLPQYIHVPAFQLCVYVGQLNTHAEATHICLSHHRNTSDSSDSTIRLAVAPDLITLGVLDAVMQLWRDPSFPQPIRAWLGAQSVSESGGFPYLWSDGVTVNSSLFALGQPDGRTTDRFPQKCVSTASRLSYNTPARLADAACNTRMNFFCTVSTGDLRALPDTTTAAPTPAPTTTPTHRPTASPTPAPTTNCTGCSFGTAGPCKTVIPGIRPVTLCFPAIPDTSPGGGSCLSDLIRCNNTAHPTSSPTPSPVAPTSPPSPLGPCGTRCTDGVTDSTAECIINQNIAAARQLPPGLCTVTSGGQCHPDYDRCVPSAAPTSARPPAVGCTGCTPLGPGPHMCRGNNPGIGVLPSYCTGFITGTTDCPLDFTRCVECSGCGPGSAPSPFTCRGSQAGPIPSSICTDFRNGATDLSCPVDFEVCPEVIIGG